MLTLRLLTLLLHHLRFRFILRYFPTLSHFLLILQITLPWLLLSPLLLLQFQLLPHLKFRLPRRLSVQIFPRSLIMQDRLQSLVPHNRYLPLHHLILLLLTLLIHLNFPLRRLHH